MGSRGSNIFLVLHRHYAFMYSRVSERIATLIRCLINNNTLPKVGRFMIFLILVKMAVAILCGNGVSI